MTISNHAFEADTGKILDIVINSLYSQKEIFLRELISNASDALNKRRVEGSVDGALLAETVGEIVLEAHEKKKILKISDNGIGLDEADMVEALGTIARSGTKAFLDNLQSNDDKDAGEANLIGQFGVGFYSAFMVADKVEVVSKRLERTQLLNGKVMVRPATLLNRQNAMQREQRLHFILKKQIKNMPAMYA